MSTYKEIPWPAFRNNVKDFLDLAKNKNYVHAVTEADITKVMTLFNERKQKGIEHNSITAYLLWAYAHAIKEHPELQGIKQGKKIIIFDDVDVAMMVEKDMPNGKKIPFPYIFRSVQKKTYEELCIELQDAKKMDFGEIQKKKKSLIIKKLPKFLRMFILRKLLSNPAKSKEVLGTIALTSLGMVLTNRKFWPVPLGPYPCTIASGASYFIKEGNTEKQMLCLTMCIDHDLSDGAPVARFGNTFMDLLESGKGII